MTKGYFIRLGLFIVFCVLLIWGLTWLSERPWKSTDLRKEYEGEGHSYHIVRERDNGTEYWEK